MALDRGDTTNLDIFTDHRKELQLVLEDVVSKYVWRGALLHHSVFQNDAAYSSIVHFEVCIVSLNLV